MDFYHGTSIAGLTELSPFNSGKSNLDQACVYLTTSRQLALHYIWDTNRCPGKMPMLDVRKDGILVFQEMFAGALEYFYKELSGYIYHCTGNYQINEKIGIINCASSKMPVPINDFEYIDDVYEEILKYRDLGKFIYEKYEELPKWRYDKIKEIVFRLIKHNDSINNQNQPEAIFYKKCFPNLWEEAIELDRKKQFDIK